MTEVTAAGGLEEPVTAAPRPTRLGRLGRMDPAWLAVAALMLVFVVAYAPDVYRRQTNFLSFSWDMGIFDQAVWVLSRFHSFITVRGLNFFGHHASPAMLLYVPFYWVGAGAQFLNFTQVCSMALGAVPVFLLARDRLDNRWLAVGLAAVFLLHPALGFMAWELFHPEVMAIAPLLFAYWFASRQRWNWFAASAIFAVAWKEDVALLVLVMGLVIALRYNRRVGLTTAAISIVYYLLVTRVLLPAVTGEVFYEQLYRGVGGSPVHIVSNAVKDPSNVFGRLSNGEARHYLWQLFAPFGPAPLAAPEIAALAGPQLLANLLSDYVWTREITVHYAALPVTALTLASVEGVALVRIQTVRNLLVTLAVVCALVTTVGWGLSPIGREHDRGWWAFDYDGNRKAIKEQALRLIPAGESVSATYLLVPHLAHRRAIYEYPNPFETRSWGIRDQHPHDPAKVHWIIVDTFSVSPDEIGPLDRLIVSGEFRLRFNREGIKVAERVRASAAGRDP
jgi:uncharacterized membrane protein